MLTANAAFATELRVTVNNIDIDRGGQLIVMIFGQKGFPKDHKQAIHYQTQTSLQSTMRFTFDVSMEELAIKILHDENKDGKVTKNWTGIYPKEGLGFSNGQKVGLTGPPKYKYSKLSKEQLMNETIISIIYP